VSLPVTNLDDRRFQDIVDEAKRMIPKHCPEWTNHNLSDPGVALIELFAWMTETMLFRLNQVPDVFYTRMLNLLGFEHFPVSAAQADLTFFCSVADDRQVEIPAGTQVSTVGAIGETRVFTTLQHGIIAAPRLNAALTSTHDGVYENAWEDLSLRIRPVEIFPGTPPARDAAFYLGFERSLAGNVIRLDVEADVVAGIGVMPHRPAYVWEAWQGQGWAGVAIPDIEGDGQISDTTGGLNSNGHLVLSIPAKHEPSTLGGVRAHWLRARLLPETSDRPGYKASPLLRHVRATTLGGTVRAEHSEPVGSEIIGRSTGRPDQVFRSSRWPILKRRGEETLQVVIPAHDEEKKRVEEEVQVWTEVADFVGSADDDRNFTWNSSTGEIRFGPLVRDPDGTPRQHGAIPREGAILRLTGYRTGGGAIGNVGVGKLSGLRSSIAYVTSVKNLEPATGGVDAETTENAKLRGPLTLRAGGRAVTISDYERLAIEADSRIGRVRCVPPSVPGGAVKLLVVPQIDKPPEMLGLDDFILTDDMVKAMQLYLDDRRTLGTTVEITTPYYQGVTVAARVFAKRGWNPAPLQMLAERALYEYIHPLIGGPDGNGWPFATDLSSAHVYQVLESIEGVAAVESVLLFEYDLRNNRRRDSSGTETVKLGLNSLFLSPPNKHHVFVQPRGAPL
jgi:predicted phage baseplate assembly protein